MRINLLLACLLAFLVFTGCATVPETPSGAEIARLKNRIRVLEDELKQTRKENLTLKETITELERIVEEKTILTMPTATDIQTALANAGFYQGKVDGQIGPNTIQAIKQFQEANDLTPDGVVGSRTWELLHKYYKSEAEKK